MNTIRPHSHNFIFFVSLLLCFFFSFLFALNAHAEKADHHNHNKHQKHSEHEHGKHTEHEAVSKISEQLAKELNIQTAKLGPQILKQQFSTYGKLTTSPEQLSHVRARFAGLITDVNVTVGDKVKVGTRLASVESNESLHNFKIHSPINGMVIQRHANTGEFTSNQVLFAIANFDKLWAELRIYPPQRSLVQSGQAIEIIANNTVFSGLIAHLIPLVDQPYQLARVEIDNTQLQLSPGDFVEGNIVYAKFKVHKAVVNEAIQIVDNKPGVFVKSGEAYTFTPVKIGRSDQHYSEVLSGIDEHDEYVIKNSYLLKADIEKSKAEHVH